MNILNKAFHEITFQDVVDCCAAETLESAVLDYKETMPRDLAKHFATFSNTHGGMILIGVKEDPATGKPLKYEGITFESKAIDQIHQFAANVTPFPRYEVKPTDEVNGKVFIVIRIFSGDQPPYMSNSDSTIRLRTGNVSTPLRTVESVELARLYEKRSSAATLRDAAISSSFAIYDASLDRAIKEWKEAKTDPHRSISDTQVGEHASPFRVIVMPVAPANPIVDYRVIKNKMDEYRVHTHYHGDFPDLEYETFPGGITFAKWSWTDSGFEFGLVTEQGVIDSVEDILKYDEGNGSRQIWMGRMVGFLVRQLDVSRKFYNTVGFNGLLVCKITLSDALDAAVHPPIPEGYSYHGRGSKLTKLAEYEWEVANLDTVKLNDLEALSNEVIETIQKFYWSFGMHEARVDVIKAYLRQLGWKIPKDD